jgi:hypothetical protein
MYYGMMITHQIHFGRKFYQDKKTGYWMSTDYGKGNPRMRAHQWVWINHHGMIPKGLHIHHIDGDKSNNDISNLQILNVITHVYKHMNTERRKKSAERCDKIRHLTKAWHSSEEGKAWHAYHALKCKFGKWEPREHECLVCKSKFQSTKRSRTKFCSNLCKSQFRRNNKTDHIEKICVSCGNLFQANKYSKVKNCSRKCGGAMRKKCR